jgi:biotin carboxyl carrier protein
MQREANSLVAIDAPQDSAYAGPVEVVTHEVAVGASVKAGQPVMQIRLTDLQDEKKVANQRVNTAREALVEAEVVTGQSVRSHALKIERLKLERAAAAEAVRQWEQTGRADFIRRSELAVRERSLALKQLMAEASPTLDQESVAPSDDSAAIRTDVDSPDPRPDPQQRLEREAVAIARAYLDIESKRHEQRLRVELPAKGDQLALALREADEALAQAIELEPIVAMRARQRLAEARERLEQARALSDQLEAMEDSTSVMAMTDGVVTRLLPVGRSVKPGQPLGLIRLTETAAE